MATQKSKKERYYCSKIVKGGGPGFYDLIILPRNKIAPQFTLILLDGSKVKWRLWIRSLNITNFQEGECTFIASIPPGLKVITHYNANTREGWMEKYTEER